MVGYLVLMEIVSEVPYPCLAGSADTCIILSCGGLYLDPAQPADPALPLLSWFC